MIAGGGAVDPHELADERDARREGALAARVLDRVRDLVRRDRDGGDRAAVVMLRQEPHRPRLRIVMVAAVGGLDLHAVQARLVEQMARKLAAGAGQIGPVGAVAAQHVMDPHLRAEHDREQDQQYEACDDRHGGVAFSNIPECDRHYILPPQRERMRGAWRET